MQKRILLRIKEMVKNGGVHQPKSLDSEGEEPYVSAMVWKITVFVEKRDAVFPPRGEASDRS